MVGFFRSEEALNPKLQTEAPQACTLNWALNSSTLKPKRKPERSPYLLSGLWSTILQYFFLKGTVMKKVYVFYPWLLKSPEAQKEP